MVGRSQWATGEEQAIDLPRSNVLKYHLANGAWFCLRPSGTEPKLKVYISAVAEDESDAREIEKQILSDLNAVIAQ